MTLTELINLARTRLRDNLAPYLWSDSDLTEFANSAVNEACLRSRVLQSVVPITTIIGTAAYLLPYTILKPLSAYFTDATGKITPLLPIDQDKFLSLQAVNFGGSNRPTHYTRGTGNTIQLFPTPSMVGIATFTIARMPTALETMEDGDSSPVIPIEFHRDLIYWMLSEAYLVDVSDTKSSKNADLNEAKFEARFGRKITARGEAQGRKSIVGSDMQPMSFVGGGGSYLTDSFF